MQAKPISHLLAYEDREYREYRGRVSRESIEIEYRGRVSRDSIEGDMLTHLTQRCMRTSKGAM